MILDTNPSGLAPTAGYGADDGRREHRNRAQGRLKKGAALPDDRLIAVWCSIGCPRWFAEQLRTSETLRFQAAAVYFLVEKAAKGEHVLHPVTGYASPPGTWSTRCGSSIRRCGRSSSSPTTPT